MIDTTDSGLSFVYVTLERLSKSLVDDGIFSVSLILKALNYIC